MDLWMWAAGKMAGYPRVNLLSRLRSDDVSKPLNAPGHLRNLPVVEVVSDRVAVCDGRWAMSWLEEQEDRSCLKTKLRHIRTDDLTVWIVVELTAWKVFLPSEKSNVP
jgi:hypothetical protein